MMQFNAFNVYEVHEKGKDIIYRLEGFNYQEGKWESVPNNEKKYFSFDDVADRILKGDPKHLTILSQSSDIFTNEGIVLLDKEKMGNLYKIIYKKI